jgi:hypothetical protein
VADYTPDRRGTAKIMDSPMMHGVMELAGHEAIPFARSISPDAPPYGEGYVSSFEVHGGTERIAGARRAVADLVNTSEHATLVEVGIPGRQEGHHVLARTADHIERG